MNHASNWEVHKGYVVTCLDQAFKHVSKPSPPGGSANPATGLANQTAQIRSRGRVIQEVSASFSRWMPNNILSPFKQKGKKRFALYCWDKAIELDWAKILGASVAWDTKSVPPQEGLSQRKLKWIAQIDRSRTKLATLHITEGRGRAKNILPIDISNIDNIEIWTTPYEIYQLRYAYVAGSIRRYDRIATWILTRVR